MLLHERWRNRSVMVCRTGFGVRPSSGAASAECCGASDFIGSQRVPTLLRPRTSALRQGNLPPSLRRCERIANTPSPPPPRLPRREEREKTPEPVFSRLLADYMLALIPN